MKIKKIDFLCSSPALKSCPEPGQPEFAFIGRSNVGKSSLINMLAAKKGIAKVSSTPGKTRLINHFTVESELTGTTGQQKAGRLYSWFLVDLPGYGFARLAKTEREKFDGIIRNYLGKRDTLALTFLLIDSRLTPQKIDLDFMEWLGDQDVSFVILFTKTDKLTQSMLAHHLSEYRKALSATWSELPLMIATSSHTRTGREQVLGVIADALTEILP